MTRLLGTTAGKATLAALLVAGVLLAAWLATSRPGDGLPLSPDSTAEDGTRALVDALEELGAEVVLDAEPPAEAAAGLLLVDNIDPSRREAWRELARGGGTLLVADPGSELAPELVGQTAFGFLDPSIGRDCEVEALEGADRAQPGGGVTFDVPEGGVGCFPRGEGHWLVARPEGDGAIVAVGGPQFLTNGQIGEADNAVLAAALLAPREGDVVAIAPPDFAAAGTQADPADLVPDWVGLLLVQLLVAFVLIACWRARRVGAPVVEDQQVALPGSELVMGVGSLYEQTGAAGHAAGLLREDARRHAAARLRLGPQAEASEVAAAAVAAGVEPRLAEEALTAPLASDERSLVDLSGTVERLRAALDTIDEPDEEGVARV